MAEEKETQSTSHAASILGRKDSSPEEKHEAARILGKKGGAHSHGGKGGQRRTSAEGQENP
jgi:hypothetical protein